MISMWDSYPNKQLYCPISVIFQSDVPAPKLQSTQTHAHIRLANL